MNKKTVIFIISAFILLILTLMGTLMYSFAKDTPVTTRAASRSVNQTVTSPTIVSGQPDPATYGYRTNRGNFEATEYNVNSYSIPTFEGFNIYCIEPGAGLPSWIFQISVDSVFEIAAREPIHSDHGCPHDWHSGRKR